jgi:hypothetical protein
MPVLGLLDIVVALLQQLLDDVLDVLADVARLGQRGRVGDREGHVSRRASVSASSVLPDPVGPISRMLLLASSTSSLRHRLEALVVVVDGDGQHLLGPLLADHVLVENGVDLLRLGQLVWPSSATLSCISSRMMSLQSSTHSSQMKTDGPGDQLAHLVLALAAERAVQQLAVVVLTG